MVGKVLQDVEVDPRGCGGDGVVDVEFGFFEGRSPRVRGRHLLCLYEYFIFRSIPAGAGET